MTKYWCIDCGTVFESEEQAPAEEPELPEGVCEPCTKQLLEEIQNREH